MTLPVSGVVPLGFSLDSIGPMARSAYDCALLLEVMAGYDASDPNAADVPVPKYSELLSGDIAGLEIGSPRYQENAYSTYHTKTTPIATQEANAPPQPLCENLLAKPCNPPLCVKRPPRTPTSEFASPEASVFPLAAPSIELRSPIILLSS